MNGQEAYIPLELPTSLPQNLQPESTPLTYTTPLGIIPQTLYPIHPDYYNSLTSISDGSISIFAFFTDRFYIGNIRTDKELPSSCHISGSPLYVYYAAGPRTESGPRPDSTSSIRDTSHFQNPYDAMSWLNSATNDPGVRQLNTLDTDQARQIDGSKTISTSPRTCESLLSLKDDVVFAGGITDIATDATLSNTALLRSTGDASIYMHAVGLATASDDSFTPPSEGVITVSNEPFSCLESILDAFSGCGPGLVELYITNVEDVPTSDWNEPIGNSPWQAEIEDSGWHPNEATLNINEGSPSDLSDVLDMDAAAAQVGISLVLPIISPNFGVYGDFSEDTYWTSDLSIAIESRGLAVDSPSNYFLLMGSLYQQTVESEIRTMNSLGLASAVILSPYDVSDNGIPEGTPPQFWPDPTFLSASEQVVQILADADAIPTQWIVENYGTPPQTQPVGSDTTVNDINNVALWVAENAPTSPEPSWMTGLNTPTLSSDPGNSSPACFVKGTLILTPAGPTNVDYLQIGDEVITLSGSTKKIIWIGRRNYTSENCRQNPIILPIKICANAIGPKTPSTDLYISRQHAIFIANSLVPSFHLCNGITIRPVTDLSAGLEYFHIELEAHDVIIANGCPCETFIDHNSRSSFENENEYSSLIINSLRSKKSELPIPRLTSGMLLEDIRGLLLERANTVSSKVCFSGEKQRLGVLDGIENGILRGWAAAPSLENKLDLLILINGKPIAEVTAAQYREDLRRANVGDGSYAFEADITEICAYNTLGFEVSVVSSDGTFELENSPMWVFKNNKEFDRNNYDMPREHGFIDEITAHNVRGWIRDRKRPNTAITVAVLDNGELVGRSVANIYREDLEKAGIGLGRYGFEISLSSETAFEHPRKITVISELSGLKLTYPPIGDLR